MQAETRAVAELYHVVDLIGCDDLRGSTKHRVSFLNWVSHLRSVLDQDNDVSDNLLKTETALQNTRQAADLFLSNMSREEASVNDASNEATIRLPRQNQDGWKSLIDLLSVDFRNQLLEEKRTTSDLVVLLDSFYNETKQMNHFTRADTSVLVHKMACLEACLGRDILRNGHVIRQVNRCMSSSMPPENLRVVKSTITESVETQPSSQLFPGYKSEDSPKSVLDLAMSFLSTTESRTVDQQFISALVQGPQGSGKSYACDGVVDLAVGQSPPVNVFRPGLPRDLLGATVGDSEDRLFSLFHAASQPGQRSIIILDNVDVLLSPNGWGISMSDSPDHATTRIRNSLMCLIDSMPLCNSCTLLICTSSSFVECLCSRLGHLFHLDPPGHKERKDFVSSCFGPYGKYLYQAGNSSIVDCVVGRSYLELSQLCGEAVRDLGSNDLDPKDSLFDVLHTAIVRKKPNSLRNGVLKDVLDMSVYSGEDLYRQTNTSKSFELGLYGADVQTVWNQIQRYVLVPLCQREELSKLVSHDQRGSEKAFCGGILLCGESGTGKTSLAFAAAQYASTILPNITFIDVACTSLIHKEVGGSEKALRSLFSVARDASPCILLLDGIENIAAVRGNDATTEGSLDRVLSTLLVELDGVEIHSDHKGGIAVIGTTRSEKWIDPALVRSGRLSKSAMLGLPGIDARHEIITRELKVLEQDQINENFDSFVQRLSSQTQGMNGASIKAMCRALLVSAAEGHSLDASATSLFI